MLKKRNKYIKHNGFTLAEVLITLVIIGVIAAMTVPTLMQTTERQEFITALRKSHSVLAQSMYTIANNNGYPIGDYDFFHNENFLDEFAKVANVVKKCNTQAECFDSTLAGAGAYTLLNGGAPTISAGKSIILADGQLMTFTSSYGNTQGLSTEDDANTIGRIAVDVNGSRKPNKVGLDVFLFYVVNGKGIIPAGSYDTSSCRRTGSGYSCAAKVLRENKINY